MRPKLLDYRFRGNKNCHLRLKDDKSGEDIFIERPLSISRTNLSKKNILYKLVQILIFLNLLCTFKRAFGIFAAPLNDEANKAKMGSAFEPQDKICSMSNIENERSYQHMLKTLLGLDLDHWGFKSKFYTGFKVHRVYSFSNRFDQVKRILKMYYCKEGKVQWGASVPQTNEVNWGRPICVYGGAKPMVEKPAGPKIFRFLKKKQNGSSYNGTSIKYQALRDLDNFNCFKLARRKSYAQSSFSIYFPNSWIGGIYLCDVSAENKRGIIKSLDDDLSSDGIFDNSICNRENSIPLQPLISDSYHKHWTELTEKSWLPATLRKKFGWKIDKVVPFLYTPNVGKTLFNFTGDGHKNFNVSSAIETKMPWPYQFSQFIQPKNGKHLWYSEIEVQEKYTFPKSDVKKSQSLIEKALRKVSGLSNSAWGRSNIPWNLDRELAHNRKVLKIFGWDINKVISSIRMNRKLLFRGMDFEDEIISASDSPIVSERLRELESLSQSNESSLK